MALKYNTEKNRWQCHLSLTNPKSQYSVIHKWCWQTFGHPGTDPETGINSGWDYSGGCIYFYQEELAIMCNLRWF